MQTDLKGTLRNATAMLKRAQKGAAKTIKRKKTSLTATEKKSDNVYNVQAGTTYSVSAQDPWSNATTQRADNSTCGSSAGSTIPT